MPKHKNNMETTAFQKRIQDVINQNHLSTKKFALAVGVSEQTVCNYKKGKSVPDINTLRIISEKYDVSSDYLLGLTDTVSPDSSVRSICEILDLEENLVKKWLLFKKNKYYKQYLDYTRALLGTLLDNTDIYAYEEDLYYSIKKEQKYFAIHINRLGEILSKIEKSKIQFLKSRGVRNKSFYDFLDSSYLDSQHDYEKIAQTSRNIFKTKDSIISIFLECIRNKLHTDKAPYESSVNLASMIDKRISTLRGKKEIFAFENIEGLYYGSYRTIHPFEDPWKENE